MSALPTSSAPLVVLAAGGTGGHMFPAEALAAELLTRGYRVALITDQRGQAFGDRLGEVQIHRVLASAVLGRGIAKRLLALGLIALGTLQAKWLLKRLKPKAVVGFGGYPSVPGVLAAGRDRKGGIATIVHEQNAVLGRANRVLAPRVRVIATSFPDTRSVHPNDQDKVVLTGNPVRPGVLALAGHPYVAPTETGPLEVLITGGSQGARVFSDIVPSALTALPPEMRGRLRVTQQTRAEDLERVRAIYAEAGIEAELAPFLTDMPKRLARAHLAICRAGASTVAELAVAGVPAFLVPLPSAADDHQTHNALYVERAGGGWMIPQGDFTAPNLTRRLFNLLRDADRLTAAAEAMTAIAIPDAARRLADIVTALGDTP